MARTSGMIASLIGLIIGALCGGAGIYLIFKFYPRVTASPTLALLSLLVVGAGPTLLGGYLALLIAGKTHKAKRARNHRAQTPLKFVPRKERSRKKK